ncbi:hypothetical protein AV521_43635 [Streptomyces sp. IMTB 2501]|uniref:hypothetical protein n=1 Tax=Streptomyces sp. IMTB 2501 TaxID=1776340 RepID=UPI00096FBEA0|nr:hypothetical protein [Streptomyces sp. IMTB 2501]OLZ61343.1 hypothetical protein AV521_43635 [Streptomyces sp. IMTB 2501]
MFDGISQWWLDDIAEGGDNHTTDLEKAALSDLLESFVRQIRKLARERNQAATAADEARQALARPPIILCPLPTIPRRRPGCRTGTP